MIDTINTLKVLNKLQEADLNAGAVNAAVPQAAPPANNQAVDATTQANAEQRLISLEQTMNNMITKMDALNQGLAQATGTDQSAEGQEQTQEAPAEQETAPPADGQPPAQEEPQQEEQPAVDEQGQPLNASQFKTGEYFERIFNKTRLN